MRGKQRRPPRRVESRGLIPAHAGKTAGDGDSVPMMWAHPRACGENSEYEVFGISERGSSPRMRGKRIRLQVGGDSARLIPAHAGKTWGSLSAARPSRAHPRACGENGTVADKAVYVFGSSPRMRGKPFRLCEQTFYDGLIPAHAGKTSLLYPHRCARKAHPRACGENTLENLEKRGVHGSSPRMRGKPRLKDSCARRWGLIPAHAGKTSPFFPPHQ